MNTRIAGLLLIAALPLAGCTLWVVTPEEPPVVDPGLEIIKVDHGWVQVRVTDIPEAGHMLHWGDTSAPYGVSEVAPSKLYYAHFYQAVDGETSGGQTPTVYTITLTNPEGQTVAQDTVLIHRVDCYLALVSLEERTVTVQYWGRFGIDYSVSWGDGYAEHISADFITGSGTLTHTYAEPGTYALGMEEIWSPTRIFFTITVE